jgi:uncharacterized lipoprotein YddW (UPF0748 family)
MVFYSLVLVCALDIQGIWIPRWSIDDHENILASLEGKCNHVFLQVFALGEAYYPSHIVPSKRQDDEWLRHFLEEAHKRDIKVSAWVNAFYSWGYAPRTHEGTHPVNMHPNWYVEMQSGESILGLEVEQMRRQGIEGYYLAPANRQVRDLIFSVVDEILDLYDFDGVHLDYVRYPTRDFVYDAALLSEFMSEYYVDPRQFSSSTMVSRFGTWGFADLDKRWHDFVRADLNSFIRELDHRIAAKRSAVQLSVAVKAEYMTASTEYYQDWLTWVNSNWVDFVCLMAYGNNIEGILKKTLAAVNDPRKIAVGLGIYRLGVEEIRRQVKQVAALPFAGVVFFSYEELEKNRAYLDVLGPAAAYGSR